MKDYEEGEDGVFREIERVGEKKIEMPLVDEIKHLRAKLANV